jgi:hypothetical protein
MTRAPLSLHISLHMSLHNVACAANHASCRMPMVAQGPFRYSSNIETGLCIWTLIMKLDIGLRTLALLAFVAASTIVIVQPEFILGARASHVPTLSALLLFGRA